MWLKRLKLELKVRVPEKTFNFQRIPEEPG
jgi:hypothetical protein